MIGTRFSAVVVAVCGIAAQAFGAPPEPVRVVLVGDSTMARGSGYGEALCLRFSPEVNCVNAARGGRSTRTYREEGSWTKVMESLADQSDYKTTYVLIQFGHNDQPGKPERSTTFPEFEKNMTQYVKDVRGAGAVPVLVTPLTRRQFKSGQLVRDLQPWADITTRVAKATGAPLVDLYRESAAGVQKMGPEESAKLAPAPPTPEVAAAAATGTTIEAPRLTPSARQQVFDYTHLGPEGGEVSAALVAKEIERAVPALAKHLVNGERASGAAIDGKRINLWPASPPGNEKVDVKPEVIDRSTTPGFHDRAVLGVTQPTLTIFRPANADGSAVLVIPGGGYQRVVLDKEGDETARRLNEHGITAAVLIYRLPGDGWAAGRDAPLQDAQRALRLLRSGVAGSTDPSRIGVLGFSAGGDLAAALSYRHEKPTYAPLDEADRNSLRPDFAVLVYPALNWPVQIKGTPEASPPGVTIESFVNASAPPSIILHSADDGAVPVDRSLSIFTALHAVKVPAELHVFEEGGHGFGVRRAAGKPVEVWTDLVVKWGVSHQYFRSEAKGRSEAQR